MLGMLFQERSQYCTVAANASIGVPKWVLVGVRVEIHLGILVHKGDSIEVADFWRLVSYQQIIRTYCIPCALSKSSLPCRDSWNAGLMKWSPVPE
jgi:hypothetical protein